MALTQQLARVSPAYLDRCRRAAAAPRRRSAVGPALGDLLDLDWALWGLLRHLRAVEAAPEPVALLDRSISGDDAAAVAFLDHLEVYDRFGDPPTLLTPDAVAEVARRSTRSTPPRCSPGCRPTRTRPPSPAASAGSTATSPPTWPTTSTRSAPSTARRRPAVSPW
ncbi:hypothetical protein ACFQ1I_44910 [Kitasatospora arboriphila]